MVDETLGTISVNSHYISRLLELYGQDFSTQPAQGLQHTPRDLGHSQHRLSFGRRRAAPLVALPLGVRQTAQHADRRPGQPASKVGADSGAHRERQECRGVEGAHLPCGAWRAHQRCICLEGSEAAEPSSGGYGGAAPCRREVEDLGGLGSAGGGVVQEASPRRATRKSRMRLARRGRRRR